MGPKVQKRLKNLGEVGKCLYSISSLQLTICPWKYANKRPTRVSLQCYHPAVDRPIMLSDIGMKWLQGSHSQMKTLQVTWPLQLDTLKAKLSIFWFPDVLLVEGGFAKTIPCPKHPCMVSWPTFPPKKKSCKCRHPKDVDSLGISIYQPIRTWVAMCLFFVIHPDSYSSTSLLQGRNVVIEQSFGAPKVRQTLWIDGRRDCWAMEAI